MMQNRILAIVSIFFSIYLLPDVVRAADKPNIILLVSDDTGWGDFGSYGGGEGRGMPTPNFDRMAKNGMQFWSFYGQPSCHLEEQLCRQVDIHYAVV